MYCNREFLYTSSTDYTISKIYIKYWKVDNCIRLKNNWLKKILKIENRKLSAFIFGIDAESMELLMIEETTGVCAVAFSIPNHHVSETKKIFDRRE